MNNKLAKIAVFASKINRQHVQIFFAVLAHVQFKSGFLPYFFGFAGILFFVYGILRLSRKEQYPRDEEERL